MAFALSVILQTDEREPFSRISKAPFRKTVIVISNFNGASNFRVPLP